MRARNGSESLRPVVAVCRTSRQDFITVSRRRPVDSLCMSVMAGSPRWTYLLLPDMPHWPNFRSVTLRKALLDFLSSEGP